MTDNTQHCVVIGVAGGSASGKSTLVKRIRETFAPDEVATLCHDFYYKAHNDLTYEERSQLNYDHPDSFDTDMMIRDILHLRSGLPIHHPVYSFVDHNRTDQTVLLKPAKVLILDGVLILENKELRDLMDIKIFVDTAADVRLGRRLLRDVEERGRDVNSVLTQYFATVKPMHDQFVEPSKKYAHLIIPEGGFNSVGINLLIENIKAVIQNNAQATAL